MPTGSNTLVTETGDGVEASFEEDLLKAIALIMVEDGQVTEDEIRLARRLYENIVEEPLSRELLGKTCSAVRAQQLRTLSFLSTAAKRRNHEEKQLLIQAMFGISSADGGITAGRMASLIQCQQILGIHEDEFKRAIESTEQWLV